MRRTEEEEITLTLDTRRLFQKDLFQGSRSERYIPLPRNSHFKCHSANKFSKNFLKKEVYSFSDTFLGRLQQELKLTQQASNLSLRYPHDTLFLHFRRRLLTYSTV